MTPNLNNSENLFVANLQQVSLEKLVKSKLEVLFQQQKEAKERRRFGIWGKLVVVSLV